MHHNDLSRAGFDLNLFFLVVQGRIRFGYGMSLLPENEIDVVKKMERVVII